MVDFPAQQPAYMGEWVFSNATSAPPTTQQIRLNNSVDKNATALYVSNLSVNGIDATDILMGMIPGCTIHLETKGDPTKWQNFAITSDPVTNSGYIQLAVSWLAGSATNLAQANVMLSTIAVAVRPIGSTMAVSAGTVTVRLGTNALVPVSGQSLQASAGIATVRLGTNALVPVAGLALQASAGTATFRQDSHVDVTGIALQASAGTVAVTGQLISFEYFHAFQGEHLTSPGITIRQWYAGQALAGFISNSVAANLVGKVSEYAFKVADSMIAYEKHQSSGIVRPPAGGRPTPPPPIALAARPAPAKKEDAA